MPKKSTAPDGAAAGGAQEHGRHAPRRDGSTSCWWMRARSRLPSTRRTRNVERGRTAMKKPTVQGHSDLATLSSKRATGSHRRARAGRAARRRASRCRPVATSDRQQTGVGGGAHLVRRPQELRVKRTPLYHPNIPTKAKAGPIVCARPKRCCHGRGGATSTVACSRTTRVAKSRRSEPTVARTRLMTRGHTGHDIIATRDSRTALFDTENDIDQAR